MGLARTLSKLGYCSRSQAAALILARRVRVNGVVREDPEWRVSAGDRIDVDGQVLAAAQKVYLMLNKPRGVVTTAADEQGRRTVFTCLPEGLPFLAPVGRLDKASEGLLLFTNDSAWAARITAPESHLEKTYHVQIDRVGDDALARSIEIGVTDAGEHLSARSARVLRHGEKNAWLEIVLAEGKNRQIRRLLAALDVGTLRLIRVAIGALQLGELGKGETRALTDDEVAALRS
jgi:23S rRNA pseudouridine2605 synthase